MPIRSLPDDFWQHDEREQTLTGRRTRLAFRLAQEVDVRLAEASPVTGGLVFHILQGAPDRTSRQTAEGGAIQAQVIRVGVLFVLLLIAPAHAQTVAAPAGFDPHLISDVYATALAFMAPRTLEPVAVSQLTIWGLHGLTALDPELTTDLHDGKSSPDRAGPS